jgi:hypothetical protein
MRDKGLVQWVIVSYGKFEKKEEKKRGVSLRRKA